MFFLDHTVHLNSKVKGYFSVHMRLVAEVDSKPNLEPNQSIPIIFTIIFLMIMDDFKIFITSPVFENLNTRTTLGWNQLFITRNLLGKTLLFSLSCGTLWTLKEWLRQLLFPSLLQKLKSIESTPEKNLVKLLNYTLHPSWAQLSCWPW